MSKYRLVRGFSMIEVLVAILIFSFGLLGMASLMTVSLKTNHSAYLRTQAIFLAQSLADRMRANPIGVHDQQYVLPATAAASTGVPSCDAGCSPDALAGYDLYAWTQQLTDFLPPPPDTTINPASVVCTPSATALALSSQQLLGKPPYDGYCHITINWSEAASNPSEGSGASSVTQTFVLAFQP